ncbi:MAG: translocation/assembly module TamB domain-containing protein [Magnetospirillum sp.]|nr:translocation/assembly module TamB domain-containing protein [Magnetospirillum sp.]
MPPRLRLVVTVVVATVFSVMSLVAAAFVGLHTGPGQRMLGGLLQRTLSGPGRQVAFTGFRFGWPFTLTAKTVTVADEDGVWLRIAEPDIAWRPARLLGGVIAVDRVVARRIEVMRPPLPSPPSGTSSAIGLANLPFAIRLARIALPVDLDTPVLGHPVSLRLDGFIGSGRDGVDLLLRADERTRLRLAGTVEDGGIDLRWRADVPDLAYWRRLAGMAIGGRLTADGVVAGRLPAPSVSGAVTVASGVAAGLAWDEASLTVRAMPRGEVWAVSMSARVQSPRWGDRSAFVPWLGADAVGDVAPASGRVRIASARLRTEGAALSGFGILNSRGGGTVAVVTGRVPRIARFLGPGAAPVSGSVSLAAYLSGDAAAGRLAALVRIDGTGLSSADAGVDRALGPTVRGGATLTLTPAGARMAARLEARGGHVWAGGGVSPRLDLWTVAKVPDLSMVTERAAGGVELDGHLAGPVADSAAWGVAKADGVRMAGLPPADGVAGLTMGHIGRGPAGTVTLSLRQGEHPLAGSARIALGREVRVEALHLASDRSRVDGSVVVADGRARGRFTASVPQLSAWRDITGLSAEARLEAEAVLDPANGQTARLAVTADAIGWAGAQIRSVQLQAAASRITQRPLVEASAVAADIEHGAFRLANVSARVTGGIDRLGFALEGHGGAELAAQGALRTEGHDHVLVMDAFALGVSRHRLSLLGPTRLAWSPAGLRLAPTRLGLDQGVVEARGEQSGRRIAAAVRLERLSLSPLTLLVPELEPVGTISGSASLDGSLDDPRATVALVGEGLGMAQISQGGIGGVDARLDGTWRAGRADLRANLHGGQYLSANLDASVPLVLGGAAMLPPSGAVAGRLVLRGDLGRLSTLVPLGPNSVAGTMTADLRAAGTIGTPLLSGTLQVAGGRYESLVYGTVMTALDASVQVQGDSVVLHAAGTDGNAGTVRLDGRAQWAGPETRYQATVVLANFRAVRRDDIDATVSGTLGLTGGGAQARLAGDVTVDRADIDISRLAGAAPPTLAVVEIHWPKAEEPAPEKPSAGPAVPLAVDVAINHAFVRGEGLDSEWGGKLTVGGSTTEPAVTGRLRPVRGQYTLLGKAFTLQPESVVAFLGGTSLSPELDVTAEAKTPDITAFARVTGTAEKPKIDFSSEPPLPKDEILARVLFGSDMGKLSVFQQIQLAQMAASGLGVLGAGKGGGFDPLAKIRSLLGLDVIAMGGGPQGAAPAAPGANTGPTLSLGKYVGENTFVRVEQGLQGLGQVSVEREITHGFSIFTSVGPQSGEGAGVSWHYDY